MADHFKIQQLEQEITLLKMAHTQTNNIVRAAIIDIDEGDYDNALHLLKGIVGDETS